MNIYNFVLAMCLFVYNVHAGMPYEDLENNYNKLNDYRQKK